MDVVETWTGQEACYLQAALRESTEGFASRLGVAVRTVATWHKDPTIVPRSEIQQALDTLHEKAPE
ncbi:NUDIX hydrolase, partial [Streptomyces sp. A73]|nr:NUDIX hydrolase [Streptomyces sp. A73]